jgi:hypothetical protein
MTKEEKKAKIAEILAHPTNSPTGKLKNIEAFLAEQKKLDDQEQKTADKKLADEQKQEADKAKLDAQTQAQAQSDSSTKKVEVVGAELITIKGEAGATGPQGEIGPEGPQGPQGIDGIQGIEGPQGLTGLDGTNGIDGIQGPQGLSGIDGKDGSPDTPLEVKNKLESLVKEDRLDISAIKGMEAIKENIVAHATDQAKTQARGILYAGLLENSGKGGGHTIEDEGTPLAQRTNLNFIGANVTVTDNAGQNSTDVTILGSTGAGSPGTQGSQGSQGSAGATGAQGATGSQGPQGTQGSIGLQGTQGSQGSLGVQGATGPQGSQGSAGNNGAQGATGNQGTQGTQGSIGVQGAQGQTGPQGTQGSQGTIGIQGAQGSTGNQGTQGSQGTIGVQGVQGATGNQGTQGSQGSLGATGAQGGTGVQGTQGSIGATGATGAAVNAFQWNFSGPTGATAPTGGNFRYNASGPSNTTSLFISELTTGAVDVSTWLTNLVVSTNATKARLYIQKASDPTVWAVFNVTALVDNGSWDTITITFVNSNGTLTGGDLCYVTFDQVGDKGGTGNQGTVGSQGSQGTQGTLGPSGATGATGPQGSQGSIGSIGVQGTQGSQGSPSTVAGPTGPTGPQGTQGSQGSASTVAGPTGPTGGSGTQYPWQGAWVAGTVYAINDCVGDAGNGYVAIAANTATGNNNPTTGGSAANFWNLLVQRGSQGSQGTQGSLGATGPQGTQGSIGLQGTQGTQGSQGTAGSNMRNPNVNTASGGTGLTPNANSDDVFDANNAASGMTFNASSGTANNGQRLLIRIIATSATAYSTTWSQQTFGYTAAGLGWPTLPTRSSTTARTILEFAYDTNGSINRWVLMGRAGA